MKGGVIQKMLRGCAAMGFPSCDGARDPPGSACVNRTRCHPSASLRDISLRLFLMPQCHSAHIARPDFHRPHFPSCGHGGTRTFCDAQSLPF